MPRTRQARRPASCEAGRSALSTASVRCFRRRSGDPNGLPAPGPVRRRSAFRVGDPPFPSGHRCSVSGAPLGVTSRQRTLRYERRKAGGKSAWWLVFATQIFFSRRRAEAFITLLPKRRAMPSRAASTRPVAARLPVAMANPPAPPCGTNPANDHAMPGPGHDPRTRTSRGSSGRNRHPLGTPSLQVLHEPESSVPPAGDPGLPLGRPFPATSRLDAVLTM